MTPSWLPQNIQKRVFKYILSRLQVFSNLDTDNLDVSIGTTQTQLSLKDVDLDTEKLSTIPGIFVRHGSVQSLDLKLAVLGSVRIEGKGISLTISLTHNVLDDKDEFASLLARTTNDIASSILIANDDSGSANIMSKNELMESVTWSSSSDSDSFMARSHISPEGDVGYGIGDFSGVLNRIADSALSQLNIVFRDIKIRLILEDVTVDVVISSFKLTTNESGIRQITISDFEVILVSCDEPDTNVSHGDESLSTSISSNDDLFKSVYQPGFNTANSPSQLAESRIFSTADATSLYMSAVSTGLNHNAYMEKPKPRLIWCESLSLSFQGLDFSSLDINLGKINVSLKHFPLVLMPLFEFLNEPSPQLSTNIHKKPLNDDHKASHNPSEKSGQQVGLSHLRLSSIEISLTSAMLPHGLFESESGISVIFEGIDIRTTRNDGAFFEIASFIITNADRDILSFSTPKEHKDTKDSIDFNILTGTFLKQPEQGLTVIKFAIPYQCEIKISLDDVLCFIEVFKSLYPAFDIFSRGSKEGVSKDDTSELLLIGETNLIAIDLKLNELSVKSRLFPISFRDDKSIRVPKISLNIDDNNLFELNNLRYWYTTGKPKSFSVESIKIETEIQKLKEIQTQLDIVRQTMSKEYRSSNNPASYTSERDTGQGHKNTQRIITFTCSIPYIGLKLALPSKVNPIEIDFGDFTFHATKSNIHVASVKSINVTRDMSDVDEKLGNLDIIHSVTENSLRDPVIKVRFGKDGTLSKITLSNLAFEYHVKLLDLFQNSDKTTQLRRDQKTFSPASQHAEDKPLAIPVELRDCLIGLSPLHLPSHLFVLISNGHSNLEVKSNGSMTVELIMNTSSIHSIDDVRSKTPTDFTNNARPKVSKNDITSNLTLQGYSSVARISGTTVDISTFSGNPNTGVTVDIRINDVYLKSCADSTHSLIQLMNDLKPPLELPAFEERYNLRPSHKINTFEDVDSHYFAPRTSARNTFDVNADFICDDVPTNLEFVESYYADHSSRLQWNSSSSGSLATNYSNTDILLEEDLVNLVSKDSTNTKSQIVGYNDMATRRLGSFEQRAHSHDPTINIMENHFTRPNDKANFKLRRTTDSETTPTFGKSKTNEVEFNHGEAYDESSLTVSHNFFDSDTCSLYNNDTPSLSINFEIASIVWDLHDGFDWKYTREIITNAVFQVEEEVDEVLKDKERTTGIAGIHMNQNSSLTSNSPNLEVNNLQEQEQEQELDEVVGGYLFNSIFIGMSTNQDSSELRKRINKDLQDAKDGDTNSQTSYSPSTKSNLTSKSSFPPRHFNSSQNQGTPLKLKRSKHHKVRFSLQGVSGAMHIFTGVNDVQILESLKKSEYDGDKAVILNQISLKIRDVEVLDNINTSTWNKFLTYMRSAGERESGACMINLQMENVKPVPHVPTSEIILGVQVLPLRLHVDQDTLDFITRFFEFKDDRFDSLIDHLQVEIPFIQKFDIKDVPVKLDYKPKKVDYAGLKSGHTTEFMNFFILDEADMVLRHITLHGITGFPRLGQKLNDIWMPDIKKNQLGDVLSGLAPVRSLVKIGSGIRDLVVVPVREYKKDGRVVRSIQKGAWQFARNTSNELVKFGAKLAAGTQTVLENAEQAMGGSGSAGRAFDSPNQQTPSRRSSNTAREKADSQFNSFEYDNKEVDVQSHSPGVRFAVGSKNIGQTSSSSISNKPGNTQQPSVVSLYADQPKDVKQGLQSAYTSLGRNLSMAKGAVAEIKTEAVRSGSVQVSINVTESIATGYFTIILTYFRVLQWL